MSGNSGKNVYIPKLFIETTVFNFYFEGKQGQKQKDAILLFEQIVKGKYEAFTSEEVKDEFEDTPSIKLQKMISLYKKCIKNIIKPSPEIRRMARMYIIKGIIPARFINDAIHIATATVNNLDFVISYNQGHIVKTKTMIGASLVNLREGYRHIGLSTPTEILEYDC